MRIIPAAHLIAALDFAVRCPAGIGYCCLRAAERLRDEIHPRRVSAFLHFVFADRAVFRSFSALKLSHYHLLRKFLIPLPNHICCC